jgi:CheY-like chemotaxis protein
MTSEANRHISPANLGMQRTLLVGYGSAARERVREHLKDILSVLTGKIELILLDVSSHEDEAGWLNSLSGMPVVLLHAPESAETEKVEVRIHWHGASFSDEVLSQMRSRLATDPRKKTVLVVEENDFMRGVMAGALSVAGYQVIEAANGRDALRSMTTQRTDLIVTELVLPHLDGLSLIREAKKLEVKPKIVAVSGSQSADTYLAAARVMGAAATIRKPVLMEDLLQTVEQVVKTTH